MFSNIWSTLLSSLLPKCTHCLECSQPARVEPENIAVFYIATIFYIKINW